MAQTTASERESSRYNEKIAPKKRVSIEGTSMISLIDW
jgi:hypothetical protein